MLTRNLIMRRMACAAGVSLLLARLAAACPVCHTQLGREVRARIFDDGFWSNLFVVLLPFAVFAAVVFYLHRLFTPAEPDGTSDAADAHGARAARLESEVG